METATGSKRDTPAQAQQKSPVSSAAAAAAVAAPQSEALSAAAVPVAAPVASHAASMGQPGSSWASLVSKRTQLPVPQQQTALKATPPPLASGRRQQKGGQVCATAQAAAAERTTTIAATRAGAVNSEGPAVKPGNKKALWAAGGKAARQNGAAGGVASVSKSPELVPTWASGPPANGGVVGVASKKAGLLGGLNTELLCCPLTLVS